MNRLHELPDAPTIEYASGPFITRTMDFTLP